jgi:hypothetical protein
MIDSESVFNMLSTSTYSHPFCIHQSAGDRKFAGKEEATTQGGRGHPAGNRKFAGKEEATTQWIHQYWNAIKTSNNVPAEKQ